MKQIKILMLFLLFLGTNNSFINGQSKEIKKAETLALLNAPNKSSYVAIGIPASMKGDVYAEKAENKFFASDRIISGEDQSYSLQVIRTNNKILKIGLVNIKCPYCPPPTIPNDLRLWGCKINGDLEDCLQKKLRKILFPTL